MEKKVDRKFSAEDLKAFFAPQISTIGQYVPQGHNNTGILNKEFQSNIIEDTLNWYLDSGHRLVPIRMKNTDTQLGAMKAPMGKDWGKVKRTNKYIREYALERKGNIGWQISQDFIVIDVDKQNGGLEGLKLIDCDFKAVDPNHTQIIDRFPTVITGNKGYHIYCTWPKGQPKPRNNNEDVYPGVEFKGAGSVQQVIIPGSIHPNGNYYEWLNGVPWRGVTPSIPDFLLEEISSWSGAKGDSYVVPDNMVLPPINTQENSTRTWDFKYVRDCLVRIPAVNYDDDYLGWINLLRTCYLAVGAQDDRLIHKAMIDLYTQWSLSSPKYASDGRNVNVSVHNACTNFRYGNQCIVGGITPETLFETLRQVGYYVNTLTCVIEAKYLKGIY